MPPLQACRLCESGVAEEFHAPRICASLVSHLQAARPCDSAVSAELHCARDCSSVVWTEGFNAFWVNVQAAAEQWVAGGSGSGGSGGPSSNLVVPNPIPKLFLNELDISHLVQDLSIEESWSAVAQLSFSLRPPSDESSICIQPNDLVPPGYGAFSERIRRHGFAANNVLRVQVDVGGETWYSPTFLPTDPQMDESGLLRWGGEDLTGLLLQEHQHMASIQLETGQYVTAHQAIRAIAARYGLVSVKCLFPDFLIRELHRSGGTPLAWMEELSHKMQAAKRWEGSLAGDTLVFEQYHAAAPPSWEFVDRQNIWRLHGPVQLPRPKNRFTFARIEPSGLILAEQELTGGECLVRQKVTLRKPSRFVQVEIRKMVNGDAKDWVFFDTNDEVVGTTGGTAVSGLAISQTPIARFEFNYVPVIGNYRWTPHYELVALGSGVNPAFSQNFSVTWPPLLAPSTTQLYDGLNPEWTVQESAVIADYAAALNAAKAAESEAVRRFWGITLGTPYLNPFVRPGHKIKVSDYQTRQSSRVWFVDHSRKMWDRARGTWEMQIEASRGV